jgi:phosphoadenosine phosphosulfate reductase
LRDIYHIYWCHGCRHPLYLPAAGNCPVCGTKLTNLTTDVRPVFARERRILEFYGHARLEGATVWRGSKNRYYYIDGFAVSLPGNSQFQKDLPAIAEFIAVGNHYDAIDEQLITAYRKQLAANTSRLRALEDEAFHFINDAAARFPNRARLVSFSGGKDSTVVSDLVRRALGSADVLHVFGDTTLEDQNTYDYIRRFQEESPQVPFFAAKAEHDFHDLVEVMGPPSRTMRWCCTIFKAGPINDLLQSLGDQRVLTFYGIRRGESVRRSQYHKLEWNDPDHLGTVVRVNRDDDVNGVTVGAKIGQQATASPIIDWSEFDVWNYILTRGITFNGSYRLGFSRVGCWLCPLNSEWSEALNRVFFPEEAARWRAQLVDFARRIAKPDPEEYVDARAWVKRFGGAGLPNRFSGLAAKACGDRANAVSISIERPVGLDLLEFLKPLGKVNHERSRPGLGEIYLEGRANQSWDALVVQAPENAMSLRFTVVNPKQNMGRLTWYFKQQATKYQTCIQCTACAAVCPQNAITVKPDGHLYQVDQDACTGCMECVTHFGQTGCLVAKSLSVYGSARDGDKN